MAYSKTYAFDINRAYVPSSIADINKYILWYFKAFITGQIGAGFAQLATYITSVSTSTLGGTGLAAATTYYYQVSALNGTPAESIASNEVFVTTGAGSTNSNTVNWAAVAGATGYRVYRGTSAGGESVYYLPGNVTTYIDTGAAATSGSPTQVGGWTLIGSSNGSTGAMDGLDRWTNAYVAGDINTGAAGSSHSWVCFRSQPMHSQTYYLVLDYSGTNNYQLYISMGIAVAPTGGSVTNAPTCSNIFGTSLTPPTLAGYGAYNLGGVGAGNFTQGFHIHGMLATDGSFNILSSRDHTYKFMGGFLLHLLGNYKASDSYPVIVSMGVDATAQQAGTGYGVTTVGGLDVAGSTGGRYPDNSGNGQYNAILLSQTNMPNEADAFDGTFAVFPVWIGQSATGNRTIRGVVQDIYEWPYTANGASGVVQQGSVDSTSSPAYMLVGNYWFPTNAIPIIG